ncbi:uncharacterized protein [Notamacropus eugenii]|uniref:uncharacterized protein n=1 Tax=Notamacropus eugenii TaxID=9315 RepID=UPI003B68052D
MVLLPHSKRHFAPLQIEGHKLKVVPIPFVNHQSKIELSYSEHWTTAAAPSLRPKPRTKSIPVAESTFVPLPHLNPEAMSIASQCPKPAPRTIILRLPYPAYKTRKTVVPLLCPQYQLDPLSVSSQIEEPSLHNSLPKFQTGLTYLPKIPQGRNHVSEDLSNHNVCSITPQCPDFQVEVPPCPDHKTMTTAAPLLFPNRPVKATGAPLSCLSHQSEMSPRLQCRDEPQHRTIVTALPNMDQSHRGRAILSSCSNHQTRTRMPSPYTESTRDITVLTNQGFHHLQTRATGRPLRGFEQKSRNRMTTSSDHDQQEKKSKFSSPLMKATSTCADRLPEISKCPIYKTQGMYVFLPPSDPQAKTPTVFYTSAEVPPVSNQKDTVSLGSPHQAEALPKLSDCITTQQVLSQQSSKTLSDVNDQTKPSSDSKYQIMMLSGPLQQSATSEHLAGALLHSNNQAVSQLGFQHQGKASLNPVQGEKILSSLNYELESPPDGKPRSIFSLNYNYFAEVMRDIDSQTRKEISSDHQSETSPNTNERTEVELEPAYHSEIIQQPNVRAQVPTCLDHFSEGSPTSNPQASLPSGPDYNIKVPLNPDCQVLPSPDPHHQAESTIINDHCCEPELDPENWTKSSLDLTHQLITASAHDKAMLDVLKNARTQPKPSHQAKAASGLDHCCEPDLDLDHNEESSVKVKAAPEHDKQVKATLGTVKKSITQTSLPNKVKTISSLDHYCEVDLDLDHREKSLLNPKYQVKGSLEHDKKTKPTMDVIQKSTTELSPKDQANSTPDSDHNKEVTMLPNYQDSTLFVSGHQLKVPLGQGYLPEFSPRSKDQVETAPIVLPSPNQTFEVPQFLGKDPNVTLGLGKWATFKRRPDNLAKLPLGHDQKAKIPTNLHQQSLPQLFPHSDCTKAVSNIHSQDQKKNNGKSTWFFRYFKSYTTGRGNISNKIVNNIIGSIPKEKIKNDILKQILLRQIEKRPHSRPGPRLSCNYPICLICASWVPHGCIHTNMIKEYGRAKLVAIPMPVPGSKEEMGIKFVLQVPEKRLSSTYLQTHHYNVPYHSGYNPQALTLLDPVPPRSPAYHHLPERVTRLRSNHGKDYQPIKEKKYVNQKPFERKIPTKSSNTIEVRPKTPKGVFTTLLEKIQNKRMH